jgi:hypothetical protein
VPRPAVPHLFILAIALALAPAVWAQQQWRNVGTLTCTTNPNAKTNPVSALSCSFKGYAGLEGDFEGKSPGGEVGQEIGKRVLVWTVLTTKTDLALSDLAGPYAPAGGGQRSPLLLGGAGRVVQLQPMTATPQDADGPAALIELSLKPTKA